MKTIHLHIGTKKTGTTTLQTILGANRNKLLSLGYYYPKAGITASTQGHHMLAWALEGKGHRVEISTGKKFDLTTVWQDFLSEVKSVDVDNIILSTEYLATITDTQKIQSVKNYFSNYKINIILCVRRQDSYMLSLYAEAVKAGYGKSFRKFFEDKKDFCDYVACIERWEEVFGNGSVSLQLFRKGKGDEILRDFFKNIDLFDIDIAELRHSGRRLNLSPPGKLIKLIRILNLIFKDFLSLPLFLRRNLYLYHLQQGRMMKIFSLLPDFPVSDQIMTEDIAKYIQAEFAPVNRAIAEKYFSDKTDPLFD